MRSRLLPRLCRVARIAVAGGLALATSCSSALSQDRETWRCDAPYGHYGTSTLPIPEGATSISGRISLHQAYFGPHWLSTAKIAFQDVTVDGNGCHCNGLYLQAFPDPRVVGFYMLVDGRHIELEGRSFDTPITFAISIDPQGVMTVRIGREHVKIGTTSLPHPARVRIEMSCSGADVSFLNVEAR